MVRSRLWWLVVLTLACAPAVHAQTVAQLSGTVVDESGGALPGAEVTVTQTDTGMSRFVITNTDGGYVFTNLPIGPYKLAAKMSGFANFEQTGIVLAIGDTRSVKITLKVGGVSETVSVQADANLVQTQSLSVGSVTSQETIVDLPLNGRRPRSSSCCRAVRSMVGRPRAIAVSPGRWRFRSPAAPATARSTSSTAATTTIRS